MNHHEATNDRDPNLIFAGMPLNTTPLAQTQAVWDLMTDGKKIGPYTFITRKVHCYSSAKARTILTAEALKSKAGKMLLIDGDMNAGPDQITRILQHKELIVGGLYPKKILTTKPQWVASFKGSPIRSDFLVDSWEVGAGWLAIDMQLILRLVKKHPELRFLSDDPQYLGQEMFDLWSEFISTENWTGTGAWPRRLTEDYAFCARVRKIGVTVWTDTHCQVGHIGSVDFLQMTHLIQKLSELAIAAAGGAPDGVKDQLPPVVR